MIGKLRFLALALVAAALAAPLAQASSDPGFVRAYLQQLGLSKAQAVSWTTGVCSYRDKPASCELTSAQAALASQRLAQSMGAPPATRISYDPTTGQVVREPSPSPNPVDGANAIANGRYQVYSEHLPSQNRVDRLNATAVATSGGDGFHWSDGGIGAGVTAGALLIGALGALALRRRRELARA
jgi:hypothetical protein